jgi:hypothetical protein
MYLQGRLTELGRAKAELRQTIARRRADCAEAASRATRPLVWIDMAWTLWRGLAPLAQPAPGDGAPRPGVIRSILRWAPPVLGAVSAYRRIRHLASTLGADA